MTVMKERLLFCMEACTVTYRLDSHLVYSIVQYQYNSVLAIVLCSVIHVMKLARKKRFTN